ncbi:MAG: hypothetical protein KAY24_05690 [Candidatus Eisenbacteria sp.]|nr:hypothetical protein [Candidatus Eisenbacteria bacterium]
MKAQSKTRVLAWSALLAVFILVGCSGEENASVPSTNDPGSQVVDLDDPYGGFQAVDEDPAFGDAALISSASSEELLDENEGYDGLTPDDRMRAEDVERCKRRWYSMTILWGTLAPAETYIDSIDTSGAAETVIWDGSMTLEHGCIRVVSLVHFEPGEDFLLKPRPGPGELAWQSRTHGYYDGLRVILTVPVDSISISTNNEEVIFTFEAKPIGELSFTLNELEGLDEIIDVPSSNEQLSFRCMRMDRNVHYRGFCGGRWSWAEGDSVGRFKGRWVSATGRPLGYMRGHYGVKSNGEEVFFGKYINESGRFMGFLRGQYEMIRDTGKEETQTYDEVGRFHGGWVQRNGSTIGSVGGHWTRRGERPGLFSGLWRSEFAIP